MMKQLHFVKAHNLAQLHDELLTAIPGLARVVPDIEGRDLALPDNMFVEGRDDDVWLTVTNDANEAAIARVVEAHQPG